jgi:3-hydroxy acid dehydrogenase/malonic semialdehyde reductase
MSLKDQTVLITGASMGIGAAIARRLALEQATLILFARSTDKLASLASELQSSHPGLKIFTTSVNVQDHEALSTALANLIPSQIPHIDVLINNAGLALGAPAPFPDLKITDIITMTSTNINGYMFAAYAALNAGKMKERKKGTILNVTSTTGLEVPPFPGEAVYHASKACQEAFSNVLRTELVGTDIKVCALRPGVVTSHFHELRVGYDKTSYNEFMQGFEPLVAEDVADAAAFMLSQKDRVCVKALDVVPTAQRSLQVFDREWNGRGEGRGNERMSEG